MERKKTERNSAKKRSASVAGSKNKVVKGTLCKDVHCPVHGKLSARGRKFKGEVIKLFPRRLTLKVERRVYYPKYERYSTLETKIHAHLPSCFENEIELGDLIRVQECRPLSKIIHFVVVEKIKSEKKK